MKYIDKYLGYGFILNIFTLAMMVAVFVFGRNNIDVTFDTLKTVWLLSFGWICGRISKLNEK